MIVDQDIEAQSLLEQFRAMDQPLEETAHIFDVYKGAPVPEQRKSISLRIIYRSA